ncbi:ImuA family protein [Phenylobacterium sp.]|uniref:ImuA family protein n=1 Tax=Phenylobacterium sp. TaxID=1871053 RepID=UPI003002881F
MRNKSSERGQIAALRTQLATLEGPGGGRVRTTSEAVAEFSPFSADFQGLHDLYADSVADAAAVNAFGLGLAQRVAAGRPIVWGLHDQMANEAGRPHGPGLQEMGVDPAGLLLVRVRDMKALLAVGEDALRSPAVGAVLLSAWGEAKALSLTASRRLALAAETGGALFLARAGAVPAPSAAETRWAIRAMASRPLEAGAPGHPSFLATLLRRRSGGGETKTWPMEWDRDHRSFRPPAPLSGDLVPLAAHRTASAPGGRAGDSGPRRVA